MTGFVVGDQARPFSIRHAPGSDVRFALLLTDAAGASTSLPAGSVVELIVDGLASPLAGVITAGRVDWDIQSAAFAALPTVAAAAVWYRQGTWDGRWLAGYYQSTAGTVSSVSAPGTVVVSTDGMQLVTVAVAVGIPGAPGSGGGGDVTTHEAAADPHPVYLTSAEGAAAFDAAGSAGAAQAAAIAASQPLDADLTAFAAKTAPAGAVVGTTDAQTLTNKTLTAPAGIVKADVGLGNVDNTSDSAKPVSTAQAAADATKQPLDPDLTAIAALTPTTDNFMAAAASAWASRTPAQVRTTLNVADGATANAVPGILLRAAGDVYMTANPTLIARAIFNVNKELAYPITIGQGGIQVTGLQVNVSGGVASSTIRLGIRADNAGKPGTLIVDAGTVSSATTGIKTVTVAWTPVTGTRYWLTATAQGAATGATVRSMGTTNNSFSLPWVGQATDPAGGDQAVAQYVDTLTGSGALPASYTISSTAAGSEWGTPHIWLRT